MSGHASAWGDVGTPNCCWNQATTDGWNDVLESISELLGRPGQNGRAALGPHSAYSVARNWIK